MHEYKPVCFTQWFLSRNEHALLIQINWVGGISEMSELLFLNRFAVLLFSRALSNEANEMLPRRLIYRFILEVKKAPI